jgi:mRNA interferase MazF
VRKPGGQDTRKQRVFAVVSRQALIDSRYSTVICAAVYSRYDGLSTQVRRGPADGLKAESSIHSDDLVSLPKSSLTHYVGSLKHLASQDLNRALSVALGLDGG